MVAECFWAFGNVRLRSFFRFIGRLSNPSHQDLVKEDNIGAINPKYLDYCLGTIVNYHEGNIYLYQIAFLPDCSPACFAGRCGS